MSSLQIGPRDHDHDHGGDHDDHDDHSEVGHSEDGHHDDHSEDDHSEDGHHDDHSEDSHAGHDHEQGRRRKRRSHGGRDGQEMKLLQTLVNNSHVVVNISLNLV